MKPNSIDKLHELEEIKKENNLTIKELSQVIDNNIRIISKFTRDNCEDILVKMYENYREIFALDENIAALNDLVDETINEKSDVINRAKITAKDIYQELSTNIMIIYLITSYMVALNSQNALDFIKKYLITIFIGMSTFNLDLKYFTSNYRKNKLKNEAAELDFTLEVNKHTISTLKEYRRLFQKEIDFEREKLTEIIPKMDENETYEEYIKRIFPFAENIEFIPVEEKVKRRER